MESLQSTGFGGRTVISFESRRAREMEELIRNKGGVPIVAPSMRELPLEESPGPVELLRRLETGAVDVMVLLTGVGTRALVTALAPHASPERIARLLRGTVVVARGPKPVAALRELGLVPDLVAREPNTWREILAVFDDKQPVRGKRVAVQEYGASNPELLDGLVARGAEVFPVEVYRWAMPLDAEPLRGAVTSLAHGRADVALFTSATQVENVLAVADELHLRPELLREMNRMMVASIGPVCSEALRRHGLSVDLEPSQGKMGRLVGEAAASSASILDGKRDR